MTLPDGKPILLIEDDENDALLLEVAFQKAGLHDMLDVVTDVDAATKHLLAAGPSPASPKGALPQIILLDLTLPGKSGFHFLQWIRQQPGLKHLPVLVFTSSRYKESRRRAFELGATSYMIKPLGLDQLRAFARSIVDYWLKLVALSAGPA